MFNFTPTDETHKLHVPDFEDARADFAPYYGGYGHGDDEKTLRQSQQEVSVEMAKLGGAVYKFVEGVFRMGEQERHGFEIHFMYAGRQGVIRVAGLPMRNETKKKTLSVKIQALKNVRDWLKVTVTAQIFAPGHDPLLGHMLLPDGTTTVAEYIQQQNDLPRLQSGNGIVVESE